VARAALAASRLRVGEWITSVPAFAAVINRGGRAVLMSFFVGPQELRDDLGIRLRLHCMILRVAVRMILLGEVGLGQEPPPE
jgi:hypothetical protein